MTMWAAYLADVAPNGRHRDFPEWSAEPEPWTFRRSDGLLTPHKAESPHAFWRDAIEAGMRLADKHIPLGAPPLPGMRDRDDPDYGPLWEMEEPTPGLPLALPQVVEVVVIPGGTLTRYDNGGLLLVLAPC